MALSESNFETSAPLDYIPILGEKNNQSRYQSTILAIWALKFAIFSLNKNVQNIENNEKFPKHYIFVQTE